MTHETVFIQAGRQLARYLTQNGKRKSLERTEILKLFCGQKKRWSTQEMIEAASQKQISRATVYNALQTLVDAGVVRPVYGLIDTQSAVYELCNYKRNQIQTICTKCHRVSEMKDNLLNDLISQKKITNFRFSHFVLNLYGECKV